MPIENSRIEGFYKLSVSERRELLGELAGLNQEQKDAWGESGELDEDAADRIREIYDLSPEQRDEIGLKGREWCLSDEAGFTSKRQGERVIEALDELFDTWEPREKYEVIDTNIDIKKVQTHNLLY